MGSLKRELARRQMRTLRRLASPGPKSKQQLEIERASAMKATELRAWREAEIALAQERQAERRRLRIPGRSK